jgi:uncharacterized membrane protein YdjX (TVP38/TMEM64 family)
VERLTGQSLTRVARAIARTGILAVFLLRKIPVPFILANVVAGALPLRYRDFVVGTTLGMVALVVGLASFGHQALLVLDDPTPGRLGLAALAVGIPVLVAWLLNRSLGAREGTA